MRNLPRILLFIFTFQAFFTFRATAQQNDFEAGLFNIGIGSVLGGVGAVINKKPEEKFGKVLLKGMGQGALGGYVVFEGHRLVREFAESGDFNYAWPSKLVNSAGTSIIENAAANRDLWERWHLNIGFNRLEMNTKENFKLSYRIMPLALAATVSGFIEGQFHPQHSLRLGTFVFTTSEVSNDSSIYGESRLNSILIRDDQNGRISLPHELIHNYQYERLSGFNSFFNKPMESLEKNYKLIKLYNKIFYTDFNAALHSGLYWLAGYGSDEKYRNNIFEQEAEYYSDTLPRQKFF